jgi:hypothetical protein
MVSKVKVDSIETTAGTGTIALNNQLSGMTVASLPTSGALPALDGSALTNLPAGGVAGISSSSSSGTAISISSGNAVEMPVGTLEVSATSPDVILDKGVSGTGTLHFYKAGAVSNYIKSDQYEDMKIGTEVGTTIQFLPAGNTGNLTLTADRGISQFTAKAWMNLNQIGTQTIQDSHGVSSSADNGVGKSDLNFAVNMANDDYSTVMCCEYNSLQGIVAQYTGTVACAITNTNHSYEDRSNVNFVVFGD